MLDDLPEYRIQEALDFIDCLRTLEQCNEDPILSVAGCLSNASLSAENIEKELYWE